MDFQAFKSQTNLQVFNKIIVTPAKIKLVLLAGFALLIYGFQSTSEDNSYKQLYRNRLQQLKTTQAKLLQTLQQGEYDKAQIEQQILDCRKQLKSADFWLRYVEPLAYKKLNAPLPVEWETEVFEKYEKPYKRIGAGFTLMSLYMGEDGSKADSLAALLKPGIHSVDIYLADSVTDILNTYHHTFLCNRLYLLNLASIYTTGFDCPTPENVIPELKDMMRATLDIYHAHNAVFASQSFSPEYLELYKKALDFIETQPSDLEKFNHFAFIRDYVNPLYSLNQQFIRNYKVQSHSYMDFTLNNRAEGIFNKDVYRGQNELGVFGMVNKPEELAELQALGKLLFYDPVLSGNHLRSCASCHISGQFFTDTTQITALHFNRKDKLTRNTPSLINAGYNHLLMADGKHYTLQQQAMAVMLNPNEMGGNEKQILSEIKQIETYKKAFDKFLKYTPHKPTLTLEHIASALTAYYSSLSHFTAPFDEMMNKQLTANQNVINGFNLFMGKAQCGTCHFVPIFNGVKPPFIGSEFEVLGVPSDTAYNKLSPDSGRYLINPAFETLHAFRTGTLRNISKTKPYMHNGVFSTITEVINFYNTGGGAGHKLEVNNQTLSTDSLHLTPEEINQIEMFLQALNEKIPQQIPPVQLPASKHKKLNARRVEGEY